jgi:hypothetical protein
MVISVADGIIYSWSEMGIVINKGSGVIIVPFRLLSDGKLTE